MLLIGMRCPYLEVVLGINQYVYTITSDGSLNITGNCGNDKYLQFECAINGEWRKINNTCKNSIGKYLQHFVTE